MKPLDRIILGLVIAVVLWSLFQIVTDRIDRNRDQNRFTVSSTS